MVVAVEFGSRFLREGFSVLLSGSGCVHFSILSVHENHFLFLITLFGFALPWRPTLSFGSEELAVNLVEYQLLPAWFEIGF